MESNDIQSDVPIRQGCVFEGVLAYPPDKYLQKAKSVRAVSKKDWKTYINLWKPYDLPLKSLVDSVRRRGVGVEVYTCLHEGVEEAIDTWLVRRGVSVPVYYYRDMADLAESLIYHNPSMRVHVASEADARIVGLKARVASPHREWVL